ADADLGQHHRGGPRLRPRGALDRPLPRDRHRGHRPRPQPPGRRPARCPRPPDGDPAGLTLTNKEERQVAYRINNIHLKAPDPSRTADWYVRAFGFTILGDEVRVFGDRFIRCQSPDGGIVVNISGARTGERLGPGDAGAHHGLEHFGFDSADLDADI